MKELFRAAPQYSGNFEAVWSVYQSPKNSSKSDAYKAYLQVAKFLPPTDVFIACIEAYNSFLIQESKKRGSEYPKVHASTFLRQRRWEGFEADAEAIIAAREAHSGAEALAIAQSWAGAPWASLKAAATEEDKGWENWVSKASYIWRPDLGPAEIRCPSEFVRSEIEKRYSRLLDRAFGTYQLTVAGK